MHPPPRVRAGDLIRFGALIVITVFGFAHAFVFLADESDAYSGVTSPFPPILRMLIGNLFQPTLLDGTDDRFFLFPSIIYFVSRSGKGERGGGR